MTQETLIRKRIPDFSMGGSLEAFLSIRNLTDMDWRQAQFVYDSRLPGEPLGGVTDIHFVPGTPRRAMGGLTWTFAN